MAGKKTTVTVGLGSGRINNNIPVQKNKNGRNQPTQNFNLNNKINAYTNTQGKSNHNWIG